MTIIGEKAGKGSANQANENSQNKPAEEQTKSPKDKKANEYRKLEDLTDSEEEVHPNISARAFHRFMRERRQERLEVLRNKESLTEEEQKEKTKLEYKFLPVDREVEDGSFHISPDQPDDADYTDHLLNLLDDGEIDNVIRILDENTINMDIFEDLIYLNLSNAIKGEADDLGYALCRLGLLIQWSRRFGRAYLLRLKEHDALERIFAEHYEESKKAISGLGESHETDQ